MRMQLFAVCCIGFGLAHVLADGNLAVLVGNIGGAGAAMFAHWLAERFL